MSSLDETNKNLNQSQTASLTTSNTLSKEFQLEFENVMIHPLFTEEEQKAMKNRFNCAKRLLTNIISGDYRCVYIWSNIVDSIYTKMDRNLSILQTAQPLSSPTESSLQSILWYLI